MSRRSDFWLWKLPLGFWLWLPLVGFVAFLVLVATRVTTPSEQIVRSQLVGEPMPMLALPPMVAGKPGVTTGNAGAGPRLVNIFASWCIPCAAETPQLLALSRQGVRVEGIAVRDTPQDIAQFLHANGDPYAAIGDDRSSRAQLALGSSGVPESFVVDSQGKIVLQHIGDIRAEDVAGVVAAVRGAR